MAPAVAIAPRPIVIVTGANGGVGFGICQRLLLQLCQLSPPDAEAQSFAGNMKLEGAAPAGYNGITLIMACRSRKRAEAAHAKLLRWLDSCVERLGSQPGDNGYASNFRNSCDIQVQELDLASIRSVLKFAGLMRTKLPYLSHLVCNAGVASFKGIDLPSCIKQLVFDPMGAITAPKYYTQHVGEISADNLGWVWQCNVFGHFALFRELEGLLAKSPLEGSRVIWCSSLEASPAFYDTNDWQLKKSEHSYESTKYQIDLLATNLDQLSVSANDGKRMRHLITEPGVCSTSISHALAGPSLDWLTAILFYLGRFFGSPHHTIEPFKAAIAAVHLILVPLCFLPMLLDNDPSKPVRFGAQTGRWGEERVGRTAVKEWDAHRRDGLTLIKHCDELLQSLKKAEVEPSQFETASEQM